jgi:glycosyltransferase involved in cell wall biosynthesis
MAGGRGLFRPEGQSAGQPREAVVLAPGDLPTTDLYLRRRLEERFGGKVRYVDTRRSAPKEVTLGDHSLIVIVRHAPRRWLRWIADQRPRLSGVAFLMDDDIPAVLRAPELPLGYALKTAWRYARTRRLLGEVCSDVWVSTTELARRYAGSSPRLVEPEYVPSTASGDKPLVYFYHGSWAHRREIKWLVPVVDQVQQLVPDAWFEIMGTDRVRRLFRGIPRVRVVHPMPWKDYLAYAGTVRYPVGLAPCFDSDFNRARSHSKLFDITRLGAAGIYSQVTPYAEKVAHGQTGLLCENEVDPWVAAIIRLLKDRELSDSLYLKARQGCGNEGGGSL